MLSGPLSVSVPVSPVLTDGGGLKRDRILQPLGGGRFPRPHRWGRIETPCPGLIHHLLLGWPVSGILIRPLSQELLPANAERQQRRAGRGAHGGLGRHLAGGRRSAGFLIFPNRLNVAISRARLKAVVACSPTLLEAMPADYAAFLGRESLRRVLAGRAGSPGRV